MYKILYFIGSTASGKSNFAIKIAKKINGSIINADSMQGYKDLPILTSSPTLKQKESAPHYFYNDINVFDNLNIFKWKNKIIDIINEVKENNKIPILCGGTGLYLSSLVGNISNLPKIDENIKKRVEKLVCKYSTKELYKILIKIDKESAYKINFNDKYRIIRNLEIFLQTGKNIEKFHIKNNKESKKYKESEIGVFYLHLDREELYEKINIRTLKMLENGAIDEVGIFYKDYGEKIFDTNIGKAIGVLEIVNYLKGKIIKEEMIEKIQRKTRNYAKRQQTYINNKIKNKIIIKKNERENFLKNIEKFIQK